MLTAVNSGRGWHGQLFCEGLGLALTPEMCTDQSQTFKQVNNSQAVTAWKKKKTIYFLNGPLPGAPRHVRTKIGASIRKKNDCVGPTLSHILRSKSNLNWNQVVRIRSRRFGTLPHKSPNAHAVFLRDTPWNFAHVLNACTAPLPGPLPIFFLFLFRWKCEIP